MTKFFDKTTKTSYKGSLKPYFLKFGRGSDNEPGFDIRAGSIKISGAQIASFFEPAVIGIVQVVEDQCAKSPVSIKAIFLVGGFATSDYLFSRLEEHFKARNIHILRPDAYLNKAVAEGAVSYYIDHRVSVRVARCTFGVEVTRAFDPTDSEHIRRASRTQNAPSGHLRIGGIFSEILAKGTAVSEETEFRKSYFHELPRHEFDTCKSLSVSLKCYRGRASTPPKWMDVTPEHFYDTCEVTADLSSFKRHLKPLQNGRREYYRFEMDVVLLFGLTELKAQIAWMENGMEKRSGASVVYDIMSVRKDESE
ncbi:hypothetical protein AX15_001886 [Amanita polypyramis BW_CC]|nr:hypothetical protein AX15_001886 [Amanita polypyramis BW_CC]